MTIQQEAYDLIDNLSDDSVQLIIGLMQKLVVHDQSSHNMMHGTDEKKTSKMEAFEKMQDLRKETVKYGILDFDTERAFAMDQKYGEII